MIELVINEVVFAILEGLFIFLMTSSLLVDDKKTYLHENKKKLLLFIGIYTIFSYWITLGFPLGYHTVILSVFTGIMLGVIFKRNILSSIFAFAIVAIVIIITESMLIISFDGIFKISINDIMNNQLIKLVYSVIAKAIQLTIAIIIFRSNIKPIVKNSEDKTNVSLINYSVLGIYMMCIFFISFNFIINNPTDFLKYEVFLFFTFLIYIVFGILDFRDRIKLLHIKQKFTLQAEYINNLETIINIIRREKHDFSNHLNAIHAICAINKPDAVEKIKKYIDNLTDGIKSTYKIYDTGNTYIDGLLVVKSNFAHENDINLDVDIEVPLSMLDIVDNDLISVISNIIDNAFDSFIGYKNKNYKAISLCTYIDNDEYYISIANNGPKIPENVVSRIFDNGFSTKLNKAEHGFGLYIVKSIVNKYKGTIEVYSDDIETKFVMKFPLKGEYSEQYSQLVSSSY